MLLLLTLGWVPMLLLTKWPDLPETENIIPHASSEPRQECLAEASSLQGVCNEEMMGKLNIGSLYRCHWYTGLQEAFLRSCDKLTMQDAYLFLVVASDEGMEKNFGPVSTAYGTTLRERCLRGTRVGEMTLEELQVCSFYVGEDAYLIDFLLGKKEGKLGDPFEGQ